MSEPARLIALLGHPVAHSLSPAMHNAAFRRLSLPYSYEARDVEPSELATVIRTLAAGGAAGANITIPHKETVVELCDELDSAARAVGAANTIVFRENRICGRNTDVEGVIKPIRALGVDLAGAKAVILGAGGAARAAIGALRALGVREIVCANRSAARAEKLGVSAAPWTEDGLRAALLGASAMFNASSMGLEGTPAPCRPPLETLPANALVFDFVYRPRETELLRKARALGLRTIEGLEMLLHQGAASFRAWTGREPPIEVMRSALLGTDNHGDG